MAIEGKEVMVDEEIKDREEGRSHRNKLQVDMHMLVGAKLEFTQQLSRKGLQAKTKRE